LEYNFPNIKIRTHVSSGTYIRSLAEDIGANLNTKAYCQQLRRLEIADFKIEDSLKLEDFGILD
jgi:tRNA pseudouridine55 synthase